MKIYTYSKARQNLTTLLEEAYVRAKSVSGAGMEKALFFVLSGPGAPPSMLKVWISVSRVNRSSAQFTRVERSSLPAEENTPF